MSRKRRNDEIDDDVVPVAPLTWFDVIPRDVCMEIATKMHPREFPLLVATGIVKLPCDVETDRSRRRIAYDIRLLKWLCLDGEKHATLFRQYASCCTLVPPVNARRMMCALLLEANAEIFPNTQEFVGWLLYRAIARFRDDIVQVCLSLGATTTYDAWGGEMPAGERAIVYDNQPALELVLDAGVDVNAPIPSGSLLGAAVVHGSEPMVRLLLAHGAVPRQTAEIMRQTLHQKNGADIARVLIAHGANVNETLVSSGKPVLSRAIRYNADVARLLLVHGAKIGPFRAKGNDWLPLLDSVRADDQELSELLLALGADPSPLFHQYAVFGPPPIDEKHWDLLRPLIM